MDQQSPLSLTAESLSGASTTSSNAQVRESLGRLNVSDQNVESFESLLPWDIDVTTDPDPDFWTATEYYVDDSEDARTITDQSDYYGADTNEPTPETLIPSFSQSDMGCRRENEPNCAPVQKFPIEPVQSVQVPANQTMAKYRNIAPRPPDQRSGSNGQELQDAAQNPSGPVAASEKITASKNKAKRKRSLTEEGRRDTQKLKEQDRYTCLRCCVYKEKCEVYDISEGIFACKRCEGKPASPPKELGRQGTWQFPCTQDFRELAYAFLSVKLGKKLLPQEIKIFLRDNAVAVGEITFILPLNIGFGRDLIFQGVEFVPKGDELRHSKGVLSEDSEDVSTERTTMEDTLPVWVKWNSKSEMMGVIRRWLEDTLNELNNFPKFFFQYPKFSWAADILEAVCQFYQDTRSHQGVYRARGDHRCEDEETLTAAFELVILNSLLSAVPVIPPHAVNSVSDNLRKYKPPGGQMPKASRYFPPGSVVPSTIVKRTLKGMALYRYSSRPKKVLGGLCAMLRNPKEERWGYAFCVMILLLAAVEGTEIALLDDYILARKYDPESIDQSANQLLVAKLLYLEHIFVAYPMKCFMKRFKKSNPFKFENMAIDMDPATKRLVDRVREIFDSREPYPTEYLELRSMPDTQKFANMNLPRLFTKFIAPLFP